MSAPPDPAIVSASSGNQNNNAAAASSDPAVLAFASANNLQINKPRPNSQQQQGRGGGGNFNNNNRGGYNNNNNMIPQPRSNNNNNGNMAIPASPLPQYGGSPTTPTGNIMPPAPYSQQQQGNNNNNNYNNNNQQQQPRYQQQQQQQGVNTPCPRCNASNHPHRYTCFKCNTHLGKPNPNHNNQNNRRRANNGGERGSRVKGAPNINPDPEADQEFNKMYDELQRPSSNELAAQKQKAVGLLDVDRVLKTIEAHDVTFITTDTGTGKSTLVPKALFDSGARVVCAESRRTATIKLAERVADLIDGNANAEEGAERKPSEALGRKVGYRIRGEYVGTEETPVMYMTSYTLFLWLLGNPTDFNFTHILIDEFHERPPDVEVTMSLLRLALQCRKTKPFKIVLMSATVELDSWASYFDGLKVGTYTTVIPRFPIHNMPLERTQRLLGLSTPAPNLKKETATPLEIQQALFVVKGLLKYLAGKGSPSDSILVFVPGRMYVSLLCSFCEEHFDEAYDPVEWYRDVDVHDLERAFGRSHLNKRKVYVATDIAEVSVTLPDVVFVIDLCLTKKPRISGRSVRDIAFPPLETFWAPQTSLSQRRGRIGRVQAGFYFNVIPEGSERLLPQTVPHICNSRVDELTMHLLQIADRPTEVLDRCFAGPSPLSLWLSRGILQDNGLAIRKDDDRWKNEMFCTEASLEWSNWLDETKDKNPNTNSSTLPSLATTAKGKITQFLPLAVQPALVVWSGLIFGLESLSILAAAVCAAGSPFYVFGLAEYEGTQYAKAIGEAEAAMRRFALPGVKSDVVAACNAMIQYKINLATKSSAELEAWLDENCMHSMRVESIIQLERQIADQLAQQVTFFTTINPEDLMNQLMENVRTLDALVVSAFSSNAILVTRNYVESQKAKSAGHGVFLEFGALRDRNVPSVVEWDQGQVAIPCVVQRRAETLFGYFSMSANLTDFCAIEAMLAHTVTFHEPTDELVAECVEKKQPAPKVICSFEFMTVRRAIAMEQPYAAKLRLLRDLVGLRTQQQAAMIKHGVAIDNLERLKEVFVESGIDARAPLPHLLSVEIRKLMNGLISVSRSCQAVQLEATQQAGFKASYSSFFAASPQRYNETPLPAEKMPEFKKEEDATWGAGENGEGAASGEENVVFEEDE